LLFLLLFAKEKMSDCSFFALFKRAMERAIAHSLFQKEQKLAKKRAIAHF